MIALRYKRLTTITSEIDGLLRSKDWIAFDPTKETELLLKNVQSIYKITNTAIAQKIMVDNNEIIDNTKIENQIKGHILLSDILNSEHNTLGQLNLSRPVRLRFSIVPKNAQAIFHLNLDVQGKTDHFNKIPFAKPLMYLVKEDFQQVQPVDITTFVGLMPSQLRFQKTDNPELKEIDGTEVPHLDLPPESEFVQYDLRKKIPERYDLTFRGEAFPVYMDDHLFHHPPLGIVNLIFPSGTQTTKNLNLIINKNQ